MLMAGATAVVRRQGLLVTDLAGERSKELEHVARSRRGQRNK